MNATSPDLQARRDRYRSFLEQDPGNPGIRRELIDLELQAGDLAAARAHIAEGLRRTPTDAALLSRQATLALAEGQAREAADILQRLLDAGEDHPALRFNLGYARLLLGEYAAVRDAIQPDIERDVATPEAHLLLSRALHHLGEVGAALLHARHYQMAHPDKVEGNAQMALLYLDMEVADLARMYAEKAQAIDADNREALLVLGALAVADAQARQALELLNHCITLYPHCGRAWSSLGLAHMLEMQLPQALEALQQSVRWQPQHIGTWHALAWVQLVTGDRDAATASFNAAMDIDRNFGETHGGLAVVAALKGDRDAAAHSAKVALRLDPGSFSARFAQSMLTQSSDPQKAQEMLQAILKSSVAGSDADLATLIGRVFSRRK